MIKLDAPVNLRQIILCATMSERPVEIVNFRLYEQPQGIKPYEIKFCKLIEQIQSGAKFEINKSGTIIKYYPGIIANNNGMQLEYNCGKQRGITYFLEYISILALFGKFPLQIKLLGITNDNLDQSIDCFQNVAVPIIKKFNEEINIHMKIIKRGFQPDGVGEVIYNSNCVKFLKAIKIENKGAIKRIRGVCTGAMISPHIINQIISKSREILNQYLSDVWIYSDFCKKSKGADSMGYALSLFAETQNGNFVSYDETYDAYQEKSNQKNYDQFAEKCSLALLDEVFYSGIIDTCNQSMVLNMMAFSERKISQVVLGRISPFTVENLRIIREFFGVTFKINTVEQSTQNWENANDDQENQSMKDENDQESENQGKDQNIKTEDDKKLDEICLTQWQCFGSGLQNLSRVTF